jgi:hypothetical protein
MKKIFFLALLAAALPRAAAASEAEINPQNTQAQELSAVKDRLLTSLAFRGEVADLIITAGMAGELVATEGLETNAEVRSALLGWAKKNPEAAATLYLHLKSGGAPPARSMEVYEHTWEINPVFLSLIKDLNAAAGNKAVSGEELELAARRLYEGRQAEPEGAAVAARPGGEKGSRFFTLAYADYRLDKAGLGREISTAGAWLEAVRGASGKGPAGLEREYARALAEYGAFVVAASAVKGRGVITEGESRGLESGRAALRSGLVALALRSRAADLAAIAAALRPYRRGPGAEKLLGDIFALRSRLEASASGVEAGKTPLGGLGRLMRASETEFSALYLRYSVYGGLSALRERAGRPEFSCFYDYAIYRYLRRFFPAAAYPAARAELAAGLAALDPALAAVGSGDMAAALTGLEAKAAALESAQRVAGQASAFNRAAQFFLWGVWFRPFEWRTAAGDGRTSFRLAFTFLEVTGSK